MRMSGSLASVPAGGKTARGRRAVRRGDDSTQDQRVLPVRIVAPARPDLLEAARLIKRACRAVEDADFQKKLPHAELGGLAYRLLQQGAADSLAAGQRNDPDRQDFGLVTRGAEEQQPAPP